GEKIPLDDGFGRPGNNTFNTPPLVESASTGPFFHNNSIETIEGAVAFYNGDSFNKSPAGQVLAASDPQKVGIKLDATQVVVVALAGVSEAFGQEATEMYIPIGQSPGVSSKSTLLGTIESVDPGKRTLAVSGPAGTRKFQIADRTLIWIDRSAQKQRNQTGTLADLQRGRK